MDYQRLVSYIYSYPEGVKGRNAGFAKALVHQGQFKLSISLRGVKTDSPEMFGIYMMVTDSGYRLIKLGECLVKWDRWNTVVYLTLIISMKPVMDLRIYAGLRLQGRMQDMTV